MGTLASNWENQSSRSASAQAGWTVTDLDALAQELLVNVAATGVAIAHAQSDQPEILVCAVSVGNCVPPRGAQVDPTSGISGRCIREGRTQRSYDTCLDPRVERAVIERLGIRSLVAAPIFSGSRCAGLVEAVSDRMGHFDADRVALVESAAEAAAELLSGQQKFSEKLIPHNSRSSSSINTVQDPQCPSLSKGIEECPPSEPFGHSPFPEPTNVGEFRDRPAARRKNFASRCLGALVLLIAILATLYILYQHRQTRTTISPKSPQSSPSALSSASPATQSQKPDSVFRPTDGKNGTDFRALSEAASRGIISDQLKLAKAFLKGNGVPRSPEKAAAWYIIAGENGSIEAKRRSIEVTRGMPLFQIGQIRFDVGKMFMNGIGTHRDNVAAYTWFELAKAAGEVRAGGEEEALKMRMQPAQVEVAKRRASTWLQSHLRKVLRGNNRRTIDVDNGQAQ